MCNLKNMAAKLKQKTLLLLAIAVLATLTVVSLALNLSSSKQAPRIPPGSTNESMVPQRAVLKGEYACLLHRDTSGPQTMECALGIKTEDGIYYALSFNLLESQNNANVGDRIQVEGLVIPTEMLSTDHWRKYNMKGIMEVTSMSIVSRRS